MESSHSRIDKLLKDLESKGVIKIEKDNGCCVLRWNSQLIKEPPVLFASAHVKSWLNGEHARAKSLLPPKSSYFIDIETRGLGNHQVWLIGIAHADANESLAVEQFFARDPLEEQAMLKEFLSRSSPNQNWISFNGKTFDESRLKKRMQAYCLPELKYKTHLDIYPLMGYITRKRNLESTKLSELEKILFPSFKRENHIAGSEIPRAYEAYSRGGSPAPVFAAVRHNFHDLATISALYLMALQRGH